MALTCVVQLLFLPLDAIVLLARSLGKPFSSTAKGFMERIYIRLCKSDLKSVPPRQSGPLNISSFLAANSIEINSLGKYERERGGSSSGEKRRVKIRHLDTYMDETSRTNAAGLRVRYLQSFAAARSGRRSARAVTVSAIGSFNRERTQGS